MRGRNSLIYGPPAFETFCIAASIAYRHAYLIGRLTKKCVSISASPDLDSVYEQRYSEVIQVIHSGNQGEFDEGEFKSPDDFETKLIGFIEGLDRPVFIAEIMEEFFGARIPFPEYNKVQAIIDQACNNGRLIRHEHGYLSVPISPIKCNQTAVYANRMESTNGSTGPIPLDDLLKAAGLYKHRSPSVGRGSKRRHSR